MNYLQYAKEKTGANVSYQELASKAYMGHRVFMGDNKISYWNLKKTPESRASIREIIVDLDNRIAERGRPESSSPSLTILCVPIPPNQQ